jgi:hypothetical protein
VCWPTSSTDWSRSWTKKRWKWPPTLWQRIFGCHAEEAASAVVELHLPEERLRIGDLLKVFPQQRETKAQKLLDGLGTLWRQNPNERSWCLPPTSARWI